ncbi:MAG: putative selenium-dependent hydroxylase accessory protein YqeC [Clostridiales bacterium]|nr:putative selenium-dependent hydroxylase accessory protein YqeC [Clostridiales bacterium]
MRGLWHQYLEIPENTKCICAVGSGGKTSLLYRLAEEYRKIGKKVLVCTTTKMFVPETDFVSGEDAGRVCRKLKKDGFAVTGVLTETDSEKFGPVRTEIWEEIYRYAEMVLVEADGSKRLPLKAPGKQEPVIPQECEFLIAVSGLSAIGNRLADVCYRAELAAEILQCGPEHPVTEEELVKLLLTGYEAFMQNRNGCFYFNQTDCVTKQQLEIIKTAMGKRRFYSGSLH